MKTIMSIAAGVAIGFFLFQYLTGASGRTFKGRIHRSEGNRMICGVCGGIAEWLGADPTLIRLAWAVLALGWGSGILLYLICAFVLPAELPAEQGRQN